MVDDLHGSIGLGGSRDIVPAGPILELTGCSLFGSQSSMQISDDVKDYFGAMTHLSVPDSMFGPQWRVEDLLEAMKGYDVTGLAAKMKKRLEFGECSQERCG
jgi:hypothetical protein